MRPSAERPFRAKRITDWELPDQMERAEFIRRYPSLFHLADGKAWPSLAERGLLSVRSLLQEAPLAQGEVDRLMRQRRDVSVSLTLPGFQSVVLRDQKPLNMAKLAASLTDGTTAEEWLELLNSMVFLFPDMPTLLRLYDKYRAQPATVVEVDSAKLVAEYGSLVRLASINTGSTLYAAAKRSRQSFRGIDQFDSKRDVKEVAVMGGIPDLLRYVRTVERWHQASPRVRLWTSRE